MAAMRLSWAGIVTTALYITQTHFTRITIWTTIEPQHNDDINTDHGKTLEPDRKLLSQRNMQKARCTKKIN